MELIGYSARRFLAKDTGEVISGYNLYLTGEREGVEGLVCEHAFLSDNKLNGYLPKLGDQVELVYNRYGRVAQLRML